MLWACQKKRFSHWEWSWQTAPTVDGQSLPEVDPTAFHILSPHWSPLLFLCDSRNSSKKSYWHSDLIPLLCFSISISRAWSWPLLWPHWYQGTLKLWCRENQGGKWQEKEKLFESCSILRWKPSNAKLWCERRKPCERKNRFQAPPRCFQNPSASRPHFHYRRCRLLCIFIFTIFNFKADSFRANYSDQYGQLGNLCSVGRIRCPRFILHQHTHIPQLGQMCTVPRAVKCPYYMGVFEAEWKEDTDFFYHSPLPLLTERPFSYEKEAWLQKVDHISMIWYPAILLSRTSWSLTVRQRLRVTAETSTTFSSELDVCLRLGITNPESCT